MNKLCSACGSPLPDGDSSQIYCSLICQLKKDPIDSWSIGGFLKINELVKIKDSDTDKMGRTTGILLKLDWHHPDSSDARMKIAEVLWDTGPSWIDATRIEAV